MIDKEDWTNWLLEYAFRTDCSIVAYTLCLVDEHVVGLMIDQSNNERGFISIESAQSMGLEYIEPDDYYGFVTGLF